MVCTYEYFSLFYPDSLVILRLSAPKSLLYFHAPWGPPPGTALLLLAALGLANAAALPSSSASSPPLPHELVHTLPNGKLVTIYHSVPFTSNPSAAVKKSLSPRGNYDFCGASSFVNRSSPASPRWEDCDNCQKFFESPAFGSYYDVEQPVVSSWKPICVSYSCVFAVKTKNFCGTRIGDTDGADVIRDAIEKFKWGDLVGAEATMGCDNGCEIARTEWALYHSSF